jgi:hypothetical protein
MEPTREQHQQSIDVTGLSDEAIRVVELLVLQLRRHPQPTARQGGIGSFPSYEEWSQALREWAEGHTPLDTPADYSRESLYPDRV